MAFIINKQNLNKNDDDATKEYTYGDTGIVVKVYPETRPNYRKAAEVIGQTVARINNSKPVITASDLSGFTDEQMTLGEAYAYSIGEHLLSDWNVLIEENGENKPLEPNGANLIMVGNQLGGVDTFALWVYACSQDFAKERNEEIVALKKKQSKDGDGKQITKR